MCREGPSNLSAFAMGETTVVVLHTRKQQGKNLLLLKGAIWTAIATGVSDVLCSSLILL